MDRRFDPRRGLVYLAARLIGPRKVARLSLAVDTGAVRTTIRPSVLLAAGYDLARPAQHVRMRSATGTVRVPMVWVASLACAGAERTGLLVAAHDLSMRFEGDGLLGLDFIRPDPLTIDFRRGVVTLGPRRWWHFRR